MNEIEITSPAKVNLFLELLGRRKDGYFQIETILQEIDLYDNILIKDKEGGDIHVEVSPALSINKEDNLAYKAAKLIQKKANKIQRGAEIFIEKRIPLGRGLGGGSSNAASVLKGLNELWNLGFSSKELAELGKEIGMDVPFFVYGGTCLGRGRGEVIASLSKFSGFRILVFWPDFPVSTAEVYNKISINLTKKRRSAKFLIDSLKAKDLEGVIKRIFNRLEDVTLKIYPSLSRFKEKITFLKAKRIIMSGSGSAFFTFLPENLEEEEHIIRELTKLKGGCHIGRTL
jgi:4-diphosphocytidyl-2-C-methyl-D-erythritol kinase